MSGTKQHKNKTKNQQRSCQNGVVGKFELTLGVGNVKHGQLGDQGVVLQQKREGLADTAGTAEHGNLVRLLRSQVSLGRSSHTNDALPSLANLHNN
jgi:hypothetical protein